MSADWLLLAIPAVCVAFGAWGIRGIAADQADLSEQHRLTGCPSLVASKKDERA